MVGREEQLKALNGYYESDKNNLTVLYGRRRIGKTALIKAFAEDKSCVYFNASPAADFDMLAAFRRCAREQFEGLDTEGGYADIFRQINMRQEAPAVFVFENSMVKSIGRAAYSINAFIKLKELGYADMVGMFPESDARNSLYMYAVTGGVPGYLEAWNARENVRSNVCRLFLDEKGVFRKEAELFVKEEFRETGVYRTILGCLAAGMNKLNDIHAYTGYGRDKISVYMNNLIEREIAEKIFSYESGDSRSVRKGLYRIKDDLINFWFRFIYPYCGILDKSDAESFYDKYIAPELDGFVLEAFIKIAGEFLQIMNDAGRLAVRGEYRGRWYGKSGDVHIIYDNGEKAVIGQAYTGGKPVGEEEFARLEENVRTAGADAAQYFIFSAGGFEEGLSRRQDGSLVLIAVDDL